MQSLTAPVVPRPSIFLCHSFVTLDFPGLFGRKSRRKCTGDYSLIACCSRKCKAVSSGIEPVNVERG